MEQNTSRRRFFIHMGQMLGLAAIAPVLLSSKVFAEEKRKARPTEGAAAGGGDAGLKLVEPGKGNAPSVSYVFKHSDVKDPAVKIERAGVAFEKQFCNNCALYTKHSVKNGEEVGTCPIFQNQLVKGTAWCASWSKKA